MIKRILLLTLGTSLLTFGAAGTAGAEVATFEKLDGKSFVATAIKGGKGKPKEISLSFTEGQDMWDDSADPDSVVPILGAYAGCNSMGAKYEVENGVVRWTSTIFSTAMLCHPDRSGWLTSRLKKGMKARLSGDDLILSRGANARIRLVPAGSARPATVAELEGRKFVSTVVKGSGKAPKKIKLTFRRAVTDDTNSKGSGPNAQALVTDSGCNLLSARYVVRNGRLRWKGQVVGTKMACADDRDAWLSRRLKKGLKADFIGTTLVLKGRGGTMIRLRPAD